jgi:hypothetical protein
MNKRFSLLVSVFVMVLFLSSCSGGDGDESAETTRQGFKTFSIAIPNDWRRINKENFANTIPEDTVVIYLKQVEGSDFIQNANVVKESLNTNASSLEYAKANLLLGSKAITDYRRISAEEAEVHGVKTVFHVFRARNSTTEPLLQYAQTYFARDRIGYSITCVSKDDDAVQQSSCEQIVKSFKFL